MQELDLGSVEKLKVKFNGEIYEMDFPDVGRIQRHQKEIKDAQSDDEKMVSVMLDFLDELGMPRDVVNKMTQDKLDKLCKRVMGTEKKS